ncbi:MAG: energy-coupling factor transporter transmembrane component T [Desulfobacterales bacterium]
MAFVNGLRPPAPSARKGLSLLDPRVKLVLLAAWSIAGIPLGLPALIGFGFPPVVIGWREGALRGIEKRSSLSFAALLFFVFAARALSLAGEPLFTVFGFSVSKEGILSGAEVALRLLLVFLLGAMLVTTTPAAEVKAAVEWFLRPLPGVPAARVGTLLGLMVRLVPLAFAEIESLREAQAARGGGRRGNPVRRIRCLALPALARIVLRAESLALAMEARCYRDERSPRPMRLRPRDRRVLVAGLAWAGAVQFF